MAGNRSTPEDWTRKLRRKVAITHDSELGAGMQDRKKALLRGLGAVDESHPLYNRILKWDFSVIVNTAMDALGITDTRLSGAKVLDEARHKVHLSIREAQRNPAAAEALGASLLSKRTKDPILRKLQNSRLPILQELLEPILKRLNADKAPAETAPVLTKEEPILDEEQKAEENRLKLLALELCAITDKKPYQELSLFETLRTLLKPLQERGRMTWAKLADAMPEYTFYQVKHRMVEKSSSLDERFIRSFCRVIRFETNRLVEEGLLDPATKQVWRPGTAVTAAQSLKSNPLEQSPSQVG